MVRRVGTDGNDRIIFSSSSDDEVFGLGGNDTLQSSFGDDLLDGGDGNDNLNGKAGNDTLKGGNGEDRLVGDKGDDILDGGAGDDILSGGANNDVLDGGSGDDVVSVTGGNNTLIGGLGNDSLSGGFGNDILIGVDPNNGAGSGEQDTLTQGRARLFTESNLFVLGDENTVFYVGDDDNDFARIRGFDPERDKLQLKGAANQYNASGDSLNGRRGVSLTFNGDLIAFFEENKFLDLREQIFVGDVNNPQNPPDNNDDNIGGRPIDNPPPIIIGEGTIIGTDGNDTLSGGNEDNGIVGLRGNDILNGRGGDDVLSGAGSSLGFSDANGRGEVDRLRGGNGSDTFQFGIANSGLFSVFYDDGNPNTIGTDDVAIIEDFQRGQDTIELVGSSEQYLIGRSPVRRIADGSAIFFDTNRNGQRDRRDELIGVVEGVNNLRKNDLTFQQIPMLLGTGDRSRLRGGRSGGILVGSRRREIVLARGGDDVVLGNNGNDLVNGGNGDDLLFGGKGRDTHQGGNGSDIFVLAPKTGHDRIQDFQDGVDLIGLAGGLTFTDVDIVQRGDRTVIRTATHTEISTGRQRLGSLQHVNADQIGADDFVSIKFQVSSLSNGVLLPVVDIGNSIN